MGSNIIQCRHPFFFIYSSMGSLSDILWIWWSYFNILMWNPFFCFFLYEKCPWAIHKNDFQIFSWIPTCMLIYLILMLSFLLNCIEIWIRKLTSVSTFLVQNGIYSTMRLTWNLVVHVFSLKFRLGVRWNFSLLIYYDTYYTTDKSIYKWNDSFPLLQLGDNHQINFQKKSSFG